MNNILKKDLGTNKPKEDPSLEELSGLFAETINKHWKKENNIIHHFNKVKSQGYKYNPIEYCIN